MLRSTFYTLCVLALLLCAGCNVLTDTSQTPAQLAVQNLENSDWVSVMNSDGDWQGYRFADGNFEIFLDYSEFVYRGLYTIDGNDITMTRTHIYFPSPELENEKTWLTRDEFARLFPDLAEQNNNYWIFQLDNIFSTSTYQFEISENNLILRYPTEVDLKLTGFETVEQLREHFSDQANTTVCDEWVSMRYTRVTS